MSEPVLGFLQQLVRLQLVASRLARSEGRFFRRSGRLLYGPAYSRHLLTFIQALSALWSPCARLVH